MPSVADRKDSAIETQAYLPRTAIRAQARLVDPDQGEASHVVDRRTRFAIVPARTWARLSLPPQTSGITLAVEFPPPCDPGLRASTSSRGASCLYVVTQSRPEGDGQAEQGDEGDESVLLSRLPGDSRAASSTSIPVRIAVHRPITLASVILATDSHTLLDAAQDAQSSFNTDIDGALVQQGDDIRLQCGSARVIQTDPVLQGIISAQTSVLVAHDPDTFVTGPRPEDTQAIPGEHAPAEDSDSFTIDERFLASSVIEAFDPTSDDEASASGIPLSRPNGDSALAHHHHNKAYFADSQQPELEVVAIQEQQALLNAVQSWRNQRITADNDASSSEVDEEGAVLLEDQGLAAIGGFNGDWVSAQVDDRAMTGPSLTSSSSVCTLR